MPKHVTQGFPTCELRGVIECSGNLFMYIHFLKNKGTLETCNTMFLMYTNK